MRYDIVAGWTAPLDIHLLADDETPSGTMTGMTAELILRDRHNREIDTEGDVTIPDTDEWTVRYTPGEDDLIPGEYRMRIKVTDNGGDVAYFPNGEWDTLKVWKET